MKRIKSSFLTAGLAIMIILRVSGCDNSTSVQNNSPTSIDQPEISALQNQTVAADSSLVPGQYIVVYEDQWDGKISNSVAQQALQFVNARISEHGISDNAVKHRYEYALRGFAAKLTDGQLKALEQDPRVDYIEPDRRFKAFSTSEANDADMTTMSGQIVPWGVSRVGGSFDGTGKKAWVLDTGIDLNHSDLNVDVTNSASFVAQEDADDLNGHGTHVAGILAAKDNNRDVVGVAAGASVVSVKVLDQNGNGILSNVIDGVNYVTNKASSNDIINMSLGDPSNPSNTSLDDAITNAANSGLKFAIAAGNEKQDANNVSPARVEHSNVWTVSAFKQGDSFATSFDCNPISGSNYGNPPIEYAAPGNNVTSLYKDGGTATFCGTSMAAPHIAGLLLASSQGLATDGTVSGDPDGNPDPIAVAAEPEPTLTVSINGPQFLNSGQTGTWTANVSYNAGAVSYEWFRRESLGSSWTNTGVTSSYTTYFYNPGPSDKTAAVKVEVTSAGEFDSASKAVIVSSADCTSSTGGVTTMNPDPCY